MRRLLALVLVITGLAGAATAQSCDDLGQGVTFCWSQTAFSPMSTTTGAKAYKNDPMSVAPEVVFLLPSVKELPPEMQGRANLNSNLVLQDAYLTFIRNAARKAGVGVGDLDIGVGEDVRIGGQPSGMVSYTVPATSGKPATGETAAIHYGPDYSLVIVGFANAGKPSAKHLADFKAALAAFRLPDAAQPAPRVAAPDSDDAMVCNGLPMGIEVCRLHPVEWAEFTAMKQGFGYRFVYGDTNGWVYVRDYPNWRQTTQSKLHKTLLKDELRDIGAKPSALRDGKKLSVRLGDAGRNRKAEGISFPAGNPNGRMQMVLSTLYLGPGYYIRIFSGNSGDALSADHMAVLREIALGLNIPN
ncbi:hypothetical protein VK792_05595 [Mesobacterium sp. TK19101]|uniref:Uncharacterized protein n=1 Tax=Mesobacterium hydrothermale TaxID=3111907 RepID=A0ABU6HHY4_9RHOB|nr:hypothetical protein [Mesobacterium sp. TK19101]MEC3860750.1 hypothetical protein [Mesobacterium sp. TK19101]